MMKGSKGGRNSYLGEDDCAHLRNRSDSEDVDGAAQTGTGRAQDHREEAS